MLLYEITRCSKATRCLGSEVCGVNFLPVIIHPNELIVSSSSFLNLLSEVGRMLGIPALAPSNDGVCQLAFDNRHLLQIVYVRPRNQILLSCPVGPSKITAEQALLAASNNFMQAAGGAVACASPDGRLVLQLGINEGSCQANVLVSAIESLLDQVEAWEVKLTRTTFTQERSRPDALRHLLMA